MLRQFKHKPSGVVLVTVLMVIVVMIIFTIGLLSRSVTQTVSAEKQVDRIRAEQFVKGVFWQVYANLADNLLVAGSVTQTIDGKTYTATITPPIAATKGKGIYGTDPYTISVDY